MAKLSNHVVVSGRIPEWGVSPKISTAVPIVASGAEVKSTRRVSEAMYILLRSRLKALKKKKDLKDKDVAQLRTIVAEARQGQRSVESFTINRSRSTASVGGRSRSGGITARRVASRKRR